MVWDTAVETKLTLSKTNEENYLARHDTSFQHNLDGTCKRSTVKELRTFAFFNTVVLSTAIKIILNVWKNPLK